MANFNCNMQFRLNNKGSFDERSVTRSFIVEARSKEHAKSIAMDMLLHGTDKLKTRQVNKWRFDSIFIEQVR